MDARMGMATGQDPRVGTIQAHVTLFDVGDHLLVQGYVLARIEIVFARGTHGAFKQMRDVDFHGWYPHPISGPGARLNSVEHYSCGEACWWASSSGGACW